MDLTTTDNDGGENHLTKRIHVCPPGGIEFEATREGLHAHVCVSLEI